METLVLGAFEIVHAGHAAFLQNASRFGPVTVGLTGDMLLWETKRKPIFSFKERAEQLELLGHRVVARDHASAEDVFIHVRPKFFVCGNDWLGENHLAAAGVTVDFLNQMDVTVVYTPRAHDLSSSRIIERVVSHV